MGGTGRAGVEGRSRGAVGPTPWASDGPGHIYTQRSIHTVIPIAGLIRPDGAQDTSLSRVAAELGWGAEPSVCPALRHLVAPLPRAG